MREDGKMNKFIGFSILAIIIAVLAPLASAGKYTGPGLSADIVIRDPRLGSGRYTGRYHFDRGGYRIEIDGRARINLLIFNSFREYFISIGSNKRMEIDGDKHGVLALRFGDAPCAGFKNALSVGTDSSAGREIQVWRCDRPKQALLDSGFRRDYKVTVWYDDALKHFVRKEANNGVKIELKKIVPGRQSPALFDIPTESAAVTSTTRIADVETVE
jgi:hypothetical protein